MPDVAVVTDTTHYLPRETVAELGVGEVSLYVNDGDRAEREADIVDLTAFYDALRTADTLPTTSQPSIGDFLAVYEPLVRDGRDIVSIHISGGISGTVEAARQAAAELAASGARIEVIDSKLACGALGMVVLATVGARAHAAPTSRPSRPAPARRRAPRACGSRSTPSSTCSAAGASAPPRRGSAAR